MIESKGVGKVAVEEVDDPKEGDRVAITFNVA
jgi:cyanate lyase